MLDLTQLEQAVIASICARLPDLEAAIQGQMANARVTKRENSGAGFFTTLAVDPTTPAIDAFHPCSADAEIDGLVHGMGFILFLDRTGHADFLEGFTYGEPDSTVGLDLVNVGFRLKP